MLELLFIYKARIPVFPVVFIYTIFIFNFTAQKQCGAGVILQNLPRSFQFIMYLPLRISIRHFICAVDVAECGGAAVR